MKKKKYGLMILLALFCCILFSVSAQAAGAKNKFVKASNGNVYYYNAQGKKAKGLVTVNGKKYYFASNGVQRTGWRCVFLQTGRWCRRIHEEIYEGKWHPSEKERYSLI